MGGSWKKIRFGFYVGFEIEDVFELCVDLEVWNIGVGVFKR